MSVTAPSMVGASVAARPNKQRRDESARRQGREHTNRDANHDQHHRFAHHQR